MQLPRISQQKGSLMKALGVSTRLIPRGDTFPLFPKVRMSRKGQCLESIQDVKAPRTAQPKTLRAAVGWQDNGVVCQARKGGVGQQWQCGSHCHQVCN